MFISSWFCSDQYKNGCLAASDLFHMIKQSIKFYTFYYHVLKSTVNMVKVDNKGMFQECYLDVFYVF